MNLQDGVSIYEALIVTLFSMGTVFLTLIIISFILDAFKLIFYKEEPKKTPVKKEVAPAEDSPDELIAVIAAAIEAYSEDSTVAAIAGAIVAHNEKGNINIKSIKRIS